MYPEIAKNMLILTKLPDLESSARKRVTNRTTHALSPSMSGRHTGEPGEALLTLSYFLLTRLSSNALGLEHHI